MNKPKYTDEYFINRGYKRWDRSNFQPDTVECFFQKRFDDENGKKYFIEALQHSNEWMPSYLKENDSYEPYSYTYSCQLYKKDSHAALNLEFFSSWTIEEVEEAVEKMFQSGVFEHYEMWGE